jgi:tripartite-type tricarboxylate transporter receptor subunit TctC
MKTSLRPAATPSPQGRSRPGINDRPYPKTRPSGQHPRRRFLQLAAGAAALPAVSRSAQAQSYPTRPITMIVPLAAGGGLDATGRVLADRMRRSLGQPVIVENVTGADGNIATSRAARARPDGYTIEIGFRSTHALNGAFYSLSYDVLNDFAPIAPIVTFSDIYFGRKTMPARDLQELIAWLKANPTKASAEFTGSEAGLHQPIFKRKRERSSPLYPIGGWHQYSKTWLLIS